MRSKKFLSAAMSLCMALPMLAVQSPASVSANVTLMGDANGDGEFNVADAVMTQKWLVGNGSITNWENVDFCKDGVIDSFDLALLCRELLKQPGIDLPPEFLAINLSKDIKSNEVSGAVADEEFIMSQTSFALELMKREVEEGENTLISPYSIIQALAMTANGADGETKTQMEKAMGGLPLDKLNEYLYTLIASRADDPYCKLSTANSIWFRDIEESFKVSSEFLQTNADYYKADLFKAPFDDSTLNDINNWISQKTDNMIKEGLKEIRDDELMYLINAIAFDAEWASPYGDGEISESYFTRADGEVQTVSMMNAEEYNYLSGENAEGFLKYYKGRRYAFAAILPDEGITPKEYIDSLTAEELNRMLSNPEQIYINTGIPKFSYDYKTDLSSTLIDMGMENAFYGGFDRMYEYAAQSVAIKRVDHITHIQIDEMGTKAAAVTIVKMYPTCAKPEPEKDIILNRPFVYAIVDTENNIPVFLGTVESIDPVDEVEKDSSNIKYTY